jgi:hypothetical protein
MNIRGVFACLLTQATADVLKVQYLVNQEKKAHAIISHKQTVLLQKTQK